MTSTTTGFGAGTNYNFNWTSNPGGTVVITNALGVTSARVFQSEALGGPVGERIGPGAYGITVTNTVNQCPTSGTVTLLQNTVPIDVATASSAPLTHCTVPDGSVSVSVVNVNGVGTALGNFSFGWTGPGGPYAGTPVPNLSSGDYFVTATKTAITSPGSGCLSAPVKVTLNDQRIVPTVAFATISSTSCDNNFDGKITVTASTSSGPGAGANNDFVWQSDPDGLGFGPVVVNDALNKAGPHVTGGGDVVGPGAYIIRVVNFTTKCFTDASTTLLFNPQPLQILTINKTDQLICYPNGSATVTSLNSGGPGNYSYQWFRLSPSSPALLDNFGTPINIGSLVPGVAPTQYPTMGAGTFFVVATKNASLSPGSGCPTPPFRIDIKDLHVDPTAQFLFTPNNSCDPANPNGTLLATASEQSGPTGDTYSFNWTRNAGPLPGVTTQTPTASTSQLAQAFEGDYVATIMNVTGTGCTVTRGITISLNQNLSKPNIINVATVNPLDCLPSGSAQIQSISIGGGPSIVGPALATNFTYEWYQNNFIPADLIPGQTAPIINSLTPGPYFVLVKDLATQCKSLPKEIDIANKFIVYPLPVISQTKQQISCLVGAGTATLAGTADGQNDTNVNYTFNWFQNLTETAPIFATTSTITNLNAGNFSMMVRNITTNCTASTLYIVPNDAPLYIPVISVGGQPRTFCVGLDGSFLARVTNLTPLYPFPYNFTSDLYIGGAPNLANPPNFPNMPLVPGFNANFLQQGLTQGTYTVRITDNNTGCIAVKSGDIIDLRTNPVVAIVEDNPLINCDPARPNGQLAASADGGKVGGFNFDWYNGATVPSPISGLIVSDNKLIGRTAGTYVVRVTNNISGCVADKSGAITDGTVKPPVPTPTVVFNRTSCITPDGWVTVTVGGQTLSYLFDWYNGGSASGASNFVGVDYRQLDIGPYSVTATDIVTRCVSPPGTVNVEDKRVKPEFKLTSTPSLCADTGRPASGSLVLTLTTPEVVVDNVVWSDVTTNATVGTGVQVFEVYPGVYHAFATTTLGCTNEGNVLVGTEIGAFNGVSANNDGFNNVFVVDCISNFPNNNVKIFNRSGILIYEGNHYDNAEISFKGTGESGLYLQGRVLPEGTYFYIIDKGDGSKLVSGYLELTR